VVGWFTQRLSTSLGRSARAEIKDLNMTAWMGLDLPPIPPLLHYADVIHVRGGPPTWLR